MATLGKTIATAISLETGIGQVIQCYRLMKREEVLLPLVEVLLNR